MAVLGGEAAGPLAAPAQQAAGVRRLEMLIDTRADNAEGARKAYERDKRATETDCVAGATVTLYGSSARAV